MHTPPSQAPTVPRVLIVGATGGLGGTLARQLLARGWAVHALTRHADMAERVRAPASAWRGLEGVCWHLGDAMQADTVRAAAQGTHFVVHAVNPPGYRDWQTLVLPMLANSIAAARSVGARLVLPGNIYNFGPDAGEVLSEASPQHPRTRKGRIRVEMEHLLRQASMAPEMPLRALVVRAGDFFGVQAPSSWFGALMVQAGKPLRRVVYPGRAEVGHAWAYLPDLAETMARLMALDLAEPDRLAPCEVLHFGGHWLPRGIEMAQAVRRAAGRPGLPIRALPWPVLTLLSPLVTLFREIREMRYLWQVPLRLDNTRLRGLLGEEPHTPLDQAVGDTLRGMGCLPVGGTSAAAAIGAARAPGGAPDRQPAR